MSVRVGERKEGELQVLRAARELCIYSIKTCKSDNVFPKSQRWILAQRIVNEALDAMSCIQRANSVRVNTESDKTYRMNQQTEAKAHLDALLTLVDLAYEVFGIPAHRIEHWTGLAWNTLKLLQGWRKYERNIG